MPKKGYKQSKEHIEKCRKPKFGNKHLLGKPAWNKGLKGYWRPTEEQRLKLSQARKGKYKGENHPNWKGAKTKAMILEERAGRPRPKICEVCEKERKIFFDHDHSTGNFRGWICLNCNNVLGFAGDDSEILKKLIVYLEQSAKSKALEKNG